MLHELILPTVLETRTGTTILRRATPDDLDALIALLADDPISSTRGDRADANDRELYRVALEGITSDAANELLVVVNEANTAIATMQLTRIPGMARRGSTRLLVEAVRVSSEKRSSGIGGAMMRWVTDTAAPALGSTLVQLTSDAARAGAHRFYEGLGFVGSHVGFKYSVMPTER